MSHPYFEFHTPTDEQAARQDELLLAFDALYETLVRRSPVSREQSTAIQHLRTAQFWAIEAISLEGVEVPRG